MIHTIVKVQSNNMTLFCLLLGMTACTFTYPLDVVRSRLAFQVADEQIYCGVCHAIRQIFTTEGGFRALYRGFTATAVAMIPAVGELTACKHVVNNLKRPFII